MIFKSIKSTNKLAYSSFDCGVVELNTYLKEYALQNDKKNIAKTFVLENNGSIIGYYSLCSSAIEFEKLNEDQKKRVPKYPIPSIKIARLAVSKEYKRKGYGSMLLKDAFERIINISKDTGVYLLTVDAKTEAKEFYEYYGFIKLESCKSTYVLSIKTIESAMSK